MLLARALAYTDQTFKLRLSIANKPPQADQDEGNLRISAIKSMVDHKFEDNLHKTWLPLMKDLIGEDYKPTRLDDQVLSDINAVDMCPILAHAANGWYRNRGIFYMISLNRQSGTDHLSHGLKPSTVFNDTVRGLQGLTTSRVEDEPVCLCALLGLDNARVLDIPVLSIRKKRILSSISSRPTLATICCKIGFSAQSTLNRCHDERMKAVWSLIDAFPPEIIFWNVPRLQEKGWRWVPSSFLCEDTQIRIRATTKAARLDEGLLVQFQGFRISLEYKNTRETLQDESDCVILSISSPDLPNIGNAHPFRRYWTLSRLSGPSRHWQRFFSQNRELALIVQEDRAVLAAVNREADGICFTTFAGAAERYSSSVSLRSAMVFSGTGKWIAYPKWCIG